MLRDTFAAVGHADFCISMLSTNCDDRIFVDNEINTGLRLYLFLFACRSRTASLANRLLRRFHLIIVLASWKSGFVCAILRRLFKHFATFIRLD